MNLNGGTFTFSGKSSIVGAGNFTVSSGTASLGGSINVAGTYTVQRRHRQCDRRLQYHQHADYFKWCALLERHRHDHPGFLHDQCRAQAGSQPVLVLGSGGFNWNAGAIYGTVQFNGGTLNGGLNLYGGTLVNSGALAWTARSSFIPARN